MGQSGYSLTSLISFLCNKKILSGRLDDLSKVRTKSQSQQGFEVAKRNRSVTAKSKERRRQEGRGTGTGKNYKPELLIQDVASIGLATRDRGWKTGRVHHFMSLLEWFYFYSLEWSLDVLDIREQFPLAHEETLAIAKRLGIRHPADPKTKEPIVMTTDFVVTVGNMTHNTIVARTIKYQNKLSSRRVMEKFEIERVYWTSRDVDWGIVTERDISREFAGNVEWVHSHRDLASIAPITEGTVREVETHLAPKLFSNSTPLRILTEECDQKLLLQVGTSLTVVRYLLANRRLETDMNTRIQPERILTLTAKPTVLQ